MTNFLSELTNKQILIKDFTYKVRRVIDIASTPGARQIYVGGTAKPGLCTNVPSNRSLDQLVSGGVSSSGLGGPTTGNLSDPVSASQIVNLVRGWMEIYARTQLVRVRDTSNHQPPVLAIAKLNSGWNSTPVSQVKSDVNVSASSRGLITGQPITSTKLNDFINDCQTIWQNRCASGAPKKEYTVNFCHSNHCSHSNHGSRGRR
jgi:hypothetical protein